MQGAMMSSQVEMDIKALQDMQSCSYNYLLVPTMNTQSAPKHHHTGEEAVVGATVSGRGAQGKQGYPVMSHIMANSLMSQVT
jgi:hypothetical protein